MDRQTAEHLFEVINSREDVLRRLIRKCAYLKYVEGRLGERILYADEILRDGFCVNMIDTPLCPLKVVTNLEEAVWDADIVVAGLPSTEIRRVFKDIGRYWRERRTKPIIISLAKGVETALDPHPHIITPTQMIVDMSKSCFHIVSSISASHFIARVRNNKAVLAANLICFESKVLLDLGQCTLRFVYIGYGTSSYRINLWY